MTLYQLLPGLLLLSAVALLWWQALGARSRARHAARRACAEHGVLFIDELAFARLSLARDRSGRLRLARRYAFEFYYRGDIRYAGCVVMHGARVARVALDPHPWAGQDDAPR